MEANMTEMKNPTADLYEYYTEYYLNEAHVEITSEDGDRYRANVTARSDDVTGYDAYHTTAHDAHTAAAKRVPGASVTGGVVEPVRIE